MAIIRWWDSTKDINNLHNHMNRFFGETFASCVGNVESKTHGTWHPAVDIFETEQEIVLKVEVPGVTTEQLHVEVDEGTLHLKGERGIEGCK